MSDWTAGYVTDINYVYGYCGELNPLRATLAFLDWGLAPPEVASNCELGFGQGMSTNIHAAASGKPWYATDFNPSQAAFAQTLASISGAPAHLYDQTFLEFCNRSDLPDFDFIGLHGIWSWISDENRTVIVDFLRRKLKVGGILYVSYNTQPGWAAMVPLRDLLTEHVKVMGASGKGIVARIDEALAFADRLISVKPAFVKENPAVSERLKNLRGRNRNYLAHEYFNRDWLPMPFSRMAEWLVPTKLNYACSAHYLDHIDVLNLSADQQALLKEIPDPMFRETVRDFCVNQQFRRDYWVKGPRKLTAMELTEARRATRVVLGMSRAAIPLKVTGGRRAVEMREAVYGPILDALSDYKPHTLGEIEETVRDKVSLHTIWEVTMALIGVGSLYPVQDDSKVGQAKPYTDKLNGHLVDYAVGGNDVSYLASPVTGGGVAVSHSQKLFLKAIRQGHKKPPEWADFVWRILNSQGARIIKAGVTLSTPEENIAELSVQASEFAEKELPILRLLGVA